MILKSLIVKTKCDNGLCSEFADYAVDRKGTPLNMRLNLCYPCMVELHKQLEKIVAPKAQTKKLKE